MSDSDKLRDRATLLFAMALKARETRFSSAEDLEKMAIQALTEAENMEAPQQTAQHQQEPQSKK